MKFSGKDFKDYWKIIKIPTYVFIGWSILGLILAIISFDLYGTVFNTASGLIFSIAVFGFVGWTAVKDHKQTIKISAWAGALTGVVSGFVGAIIGILMFYIVPDIIFAAAAQAGADPSAIQGVMAIGIYIGLITGPLISGLIGALISSIGALIAKKV